jgi:hypothetical protein
MNAQPKVTTPNPTPSALVLAHQESSAEKETAVSPAIAKDTAVQVPPRGVEQNRFRPRKPASQPQGDVKSDVMVKNRGTSPAAVDADALADLTTRLASLPPDVLAALRALFSGEPRQP